MKDKNLESKVCPIKRPYGGAKNPAKLSEAEILCNIKLMFLINMKLHQ